MTIKVIQFQKNGTTRKEKRNKTHHQYTKQMKKILSLLLIICVASVYAQNKKTDDILQEGKLLYRLEKASWYGTDHFLAHYQNKRDSIGGYLSYENDKNQIQTIFFNRFDSNKILVRYTFDSLPQTEPQLIDTVNREANTLEKDLIQLRQSATKIVAANEDGFFAFYKNTLLNFIPVLHKTEKKVYILTGPQDSNVVLIGNDYELIFDKDNELKEKKKIHNTLLEFPYSADNKDNKLESTYHSHVVTDFISATDICTLLLYKDYVEWNQHIVVSEKEVSIFNLEKESLLIMKKKNWDKIYGNQNSSK